jgi:hypothetical protein
MHSLLNPLPSLLAWRGLRTAPAAGEPARVPNVGGKTRTAGQATFLVGKHAAGADGKTLRSRAFQPAAGKDRLVSLTPGQRLTGALLLKKGAALLGRPDLQDYPERPSRIAGLAMTWPASLNNILGQHNVAITGAGTADGQGQPLREPYLLLFALKNAPAKLKTGWWPRTNLSGEEEDG